MSNSNANGTADAPTSLDHDEGAVEPLSKPISIRLPTAMVEALKQKAMDHGFKGYQILVKHILGTWLQDGGVPNQRVTVAAPPPNMQTRKQLRDALLGAVYVREEALKNGNQAVADEAAGEIERLRKELDDYDDKGF